MSGTIGHNPCLDEAVALSGCVEGLLHYDLSVNYFPKEPKHFSLNVKKKYGTPSCD